MSEMISILITTMKRDDLLREALDSVLAQTYGVWEAVVVDNGKSALTQLLVSEYRDPRLRYVRPPSNLGECSGRNLAFRRSNGQYICYLDDDDLLPKRSLESRLAFYKRHPACGIIYG